jgi:chemosensory pili system protein ChpA (sensor histidine kinase/response regulator)
MKLLQIPEQITSDEVDEEILDIFVEEAEEVLGEIVANLAAWRDDPADQESLQTLRRNFHTLKGSGRLVGATAIGELGWRFESLLNRLLEGAFPASELVFQAVERAGAVLPDMIQQFKTQQPATYEQILLISQADYLLTTKGASLGDFDPPDAENTQTEAATSTPAVSAKPAPVAVPVMPELDELDELEELENKTEQSGDDADTLPELEDVDHLSDVSEETELAADDFNLPDLNDTSDDNLDLSTLEDELSDELGDNSELADLSELDTLEDMPMLSDADAEVNVEADVDAEAMADFDNDDELSLLSELADFETENQNTQATNSTSFSSGMDENIDPVLLGIFRKEAASHLSALKKFLHDYEQSPEETRMTQDLIRAFHTLNGSSRSVNLLPVANLAAPLETLCRQLENRDEELPRDTYHLLRDATAQIEAILDGHPPSETEQTHLLKDIKAELHSHPQTKSAPAVASETVNVAANNSPKSAPVDVPDATDEFMSIFLDEAEEILENTQSLLERWQSSPQNMQLMKELQRELHTLKGGARMVGIVPMGDLSHHLESILTKIVEGNAQSNNRLQEIVQTSVDELAAMLEAVRSGVPLEMPNDLIAQINTSLSGGGEEAAAPAPVPPPPTVVGTATPPPGMSRPAPVKSAPAKPTPEPEPVLRSEKLDDDRDGEGSEDRIRVRVSLIDKLTNLAGELSISRAHMEQQQAAVKNNLVEMEQTVTRLRDQLRRLEIETEAQIISHFSETLEDGNEEFDPLELDRFSVMQQLSRSLMETISDLLSIQDIMKTLTRQSDALLIQQSRVGAELQEGIMRTRMIPFARISPRLQRISRLTARELRKQVEFVIEGENIEFERTVLNRIVAPLEHLLRNAIGHGIEDAETRQQAGKPTVAQVKIQLAKEGSDLIIKLSDDGAGLNLLAIRRKAEERNMIKTDTVISDQELMQFILEPSFSTAQKITQVSGRGVGMDVVNSEVKQLGGSLQIHSKTNEGTLFEIRLPLSLTINQALLIHIGEETLAIPLNNVDAVMRLPRTDVSTTAQVEEARYYHYMDNDYRVLHLGELLGLGKSSIDMSLIPTLLVRAGDRRVAFLVDGIEGSKEVVVKTVGPQIGAIRWIAGATILGDGRVVLILDVPTLTRTEAILSHYEMARAAEEVVEEKAPVKTIMVVDDSITVRKVTARLLKRQGMEVLTAKDGVDAVAQLQEHIPDLMLLDVEMPRMDGYELATQVRNTPELKHIPIIMITSRTGTKHRDKAEKIGINRYLGKPFNETELLENINALLAETASNKRPASNGKQTNARPG